MSDLRQAAQQALEALESLQGGCTDHDDGTVEAITVWCPEVIDALRSALEQQQAEPVSQAVIAGALFDFMGWLTTRKERLVLSSTDNASPAADAIKDFAEMRGLLLDDAKVQDWQAYTTPPQRQWVGLTDDDVNRESAHIAQQMKLAFHAGMYVAQEILKEKNSD